MPVRTSAFSSFFPVREVVSEIEERKDFLEKMRALGSCTKDLELSIRAQIAEVRSLPGTLAPLHSDATSARESHDLVCPSLAASVGNGEDRPREVGARFWTKRTTVNSTTRRADSSGRTRSQTPATQGKYPPAIFSPRSRLERSHSSFKNRSGPGRGASWRPRPSSS